MANEATRSCGRKVLPGRSSASGGRDEKAWDAPEVADLDLKLLHLFCDLLGRSLVACEEERMSDEARIWQTTRTLCISRSQVASAN